MPARLLPQLFPLFSCGEIVGTFEPSHCMVAIVFKYMVDILERFNQFCSYFSGFLNRSTKITSGSKLFGGIGSMDLDP